MLPSATDRALRARIESLCLSLEDRLLRDAATRSRWSRGRRVAYRADPLSPAVLAQGFRLPARGGPAHDSDAWLARLAAAWELPGNVPDGALGR